MTRDGLINLLVCVFIAWLILVLLLLAICSLVAWGCEQ